jgi:hypoxanthine-guanine phosphoribosyltransferase
VSEQSTLLPTRVPWRRFPEVIVHSSIHRLKGLFGYFTAKRGSHHTALKIAHALVKQRRIELPIDFVVPVIQVDQGHYNALPVAFAAVLAKHLGAKLWLDVCQINKVNHTGAHALDRLRNQPVFDGKVPSGRCLICDDVVTFGASLANLRGFLISFGAEVVAAITIGAADGSTKFMPEGSLIGKVAKAL